MAKKPKNKADAEQKSFEIAVKEAKEALKVDPEEDITPTCSLGNDPRAGSKLACQKIKCWACMRHLRNAIPEWISSERRLHFCTRNSNFCDQRCFHLTQCAFEELPPNLMAMTMVACVSQNGLIAARKNLVAKALLRQVIPRTKSCKLRIWIRDNHGMETTFQSYIRRISQTTLSKLTDISQNDNWICFGNPIYIQIAPEVWCRIRCDCKDGFVGAGVWGIVKRKLQVEEKEAVDCSMICIGDTLERMGKISFALGVKKEGTSRITAARIELEGRHLHSANGKLLLYEHRPGPHPNAQNSAHSERNPLKQGGQPQPSRAPHLDFDEVPCSGETVMVNGSPFPVLLEYSAEPPVHLTAMRSTFELVPQAQAQEQAQAQAQAQAFPSSRQFQSYSNFGTTSNRLHSGFNEQHRAQRRGRKTSSGQT